MLEAELTHEQAERSRAEREADIANATAEVAAASIAAVAAGRSEGSSPTVADFSPTLASQLRQALGALQVPESAAVVPHGVSCASKLELWAASNQVPVLVQAGPGLPRPGTESPKVLDVLDNTSPGAPRRHSPGSGQRSPGIPLGYSPVSGPRSFCVPSMAVAALTHPHRGPFSTGSAPGSIPGTPPLIVRPFVANTPPALQGGGGRQGNRPRGRDPLEMAVEELRRAKTAAAFSAV